MTKRNYRAQKVNEVRWEAMGQCVEGKTLVIAVDVAKVEQYGVLMDSEREVVVTVKSVVVKKDVAFSCCVLSLFPSVRQG